MKRAKTSEAKVQIAKVFDAASAYYLEEHVSPGKVADMELLGAGKDSLGKAALHYCPGGGVGVDTKFEETVDSTVTPSVNCKDGPGGRCDPGGTGYSMDQWAGNGVWAGLTFQMEQPHYYRYHFEASNEKEGFGSCKFVVRAKGDLDGDGTESTFQRRGAASKDGVRGTPMEMDKELE